MKRLLLRNLPSSCFDGVIPAVLGTCSDDGAPNATWLSQVFLLDDRHIAVSCQFFRKTRANLAANPHAQLLAVAPNSPSTNATRSYSPPPDNCSRSAPDSGKLQVRYYEADDSVFVDGEYLIRGLPGKILWLLLSLRQEEGRTTFLNRELRLQPFLKMPAINDDLATRLLMLQRRLDDKQLSIQLHREERGRLRIPCDMNITLESVSA